ncbi:hypothetical protein ACFL2V_08490 [Pseudomonadota bacterium]
MRKTRSFIKPLFIAIACLFLSACSAIASKPDSCDHEINCDLNTSLSSPVVHMSVGDSESVFICGCKPWNESSIHVEKGEVYAFEFNHVERWIDGDVDSDPVDGWQGWFYKVLGFFSSPMKRSDQAKWYAMVGAVGTNEDEAFALIRRKNGDIVMPSSGTLHFFANDKKGRYFNNQGTLQLQITRLK